MNETGKDQFQDLRLLLKNIEENFKLCVKVDRVLGLNSLKPKSWTQNHFMLYTEILRSFLRRKTIPQTVRVWRRA